MVMETDVGIDISDYIDVHQRATELDCLPCNSIALLPANFLSAESRATLQYLAEASTIRTLFRINNFHLDEFISAEDKPFFIQNNAFDFVAPALFVSAAIWSQNPIAVGVAINLISDFIMEFFRGRPGPKNVSLEIVVEKTIDHSCKKLVYNGPAEGLRNLEDVVRRVANE